MYINKHHVNMLSDFEIERSKLIEKVKFLEYELSKSKSHLKISSNNKLVQMISDKKMFI
jgi:hypothetical protein